MPNDNDTIMLERKQQRCINRRCDQPLYNYVVCGIDFAMLKFITSERKLKEL